MNSDQARQRAEQIFNDNARNGREPMTEYEARAAAVREKTARLKALRLDKEAEAQKKKALAKVTEGRPARRDE